jgi:hypothetical protein
MKMYEILTSTGWLVKESIIRKKAHINKSDYSRKICPTKIYTNRL